ncbi:glycosyltransferase [Polyangium jinanense]|uniref:Glycosyltransferase family 1 protein n=1 Tax=Polyangium jinanense TaxID=2829994 RepID=A0A9X3XCG3_9BACT|nr:glycosyltransferase [Polyangium jinanense]MDC3960467.1 glycosyltransferase family 1 protein [Polyangium jinanense]MDC3986760.1 glycosyltransferase family 1 protein [Polyangium jinanense]
MRVLLTSVGTRGDVQPVVALAAEMRRRGHDVRLCIPPNFIDWAGGLGFTATPIGIAMRAPSGAAAQASPPTPEQLRALLEHLAKDQFDATRSAAEGCDVIVAGGAHQYAARSIAERLGIPSVVALYAPVALPSPDYAPAGEPGGDPEGNLRRWQDESRSWNERLLERLNDNRARLGLDPLNDVHSHILGENPWLAADPVLGPQPATPGRKVTQTGAWILADQAPLEPALDAFLAAGEPPVYVGFGSMPVDQQTGRIVIEAVRAAGRRVVLSQGWAELGLIDGASDCIAIGDVNQQALFPRVAAVVHHGGAGTTTTAARAGVPQVIVPMFSDQPYWASRVRALGIGTSVARGALSAESLRPALRDALDPGVAARAAAIAGTVAVNGTAVAADLIERVSA